MDKYTKNYRKLLEEYIRVNVRSTRLENMLTPEYLNNLPIEDVESIAIKFNCNHRMYAAYTAGVAVSICEDMWAETYGVLEDVQLAKAKFMDFLGICTPDDVDFLGE